jgi:DNA-binding transcriptional LysR family regulator
LDKFEAMKVFSAVCENKSFVGASRKLNISAPAVTRSIAKLERNLGVSLFSRSTRVVDLTEAGLLYYKDVIGILESVEQTESRLLGAQQELTGTLHVTAPVLFGEMHVAPILAEFLQLYPKVSIRTMLDDNIANLIEEHIEIAIRIGHLPDSGYFARKVGQVSKIVVASPDYIKQFGEPLHPLELQHHKVISSVSFGNAIVWNFEQDNQVLRVKVTPRIICNQNRLALQFAERGLGMTRLMSYQAADALNSGKLIRILTDYESAPLPINIVDLQGRKASLAALLSNQIKKAVVNENDCFLVESNMC